MKRSTAKGIAHILIVLTIAIPLALALAGCGHVSQNIERDGYQVGDISDGLRKDRAWYCGDGMLGVRAIARAVVSVSTGTSVPNLCAIADAVVEEGANNDQQGL